MDKAKAVVSDFTSKDGAADTEVHESTLPAVSNERTQPIHHEGITHAVDSEVHQDHHHTTVQPVTHREVLPEKHEHQLKPVEHREFHHGDEEQTRQRLEADAAKYKSTSTELPVQSSRSEAETVTGEHVHHHVHERVQPVIQKETIKPEVVHTTHRTHETHHAEPKFAGTSTLPTKTLSDFKSEGGSLEGSEKVTHGSYDGHPREYKKDYQQDSADTDLDTHKKGISGSDSHQKGGMGAGMGQSLRDESRQAPEEDAPGGSSTDLKEADTAGRGGGSYEAGHPQQGRGKSGNETFPDGGMFAGLSPSSNMSFVPSVSQEVLDSDFKDIRDSQQ